MDIFSSLLELTNQSESADLLTIIDAPSEQSHLIGKMLLVRQDGTREGEMSDQAFIAGISVVLNNMDYSKPQLIELEYGGKYQLFWERLTTQLRALVLGAGHVSQPLVALLSTVGYAVTVVDDRPDFSNWARFPQAEVVICDAFAATIDKLTLSDYAAIIIVTRGHRYDLDCLRAVIHTPVAYLGMIGSQRRIRSILDMVREEGVSPDALRQLHAPIGLDIGAQTPPEIAVSIAAEVLATMRGGNCMPLSSKWRCDNG